MSASVRTPEAISLFLAINKNWMAKATNVGFDANLDKVETTSFESSGYKEYQPTLKGFSMSCDFMAATTSSGYTSYTGSSVTGGTTAYGLIEEIKASRVIPACLKIDNSNFQKGNVIIDSISLKGSVGKVIEFSAKITFTGTVSKSATQ